MACSPVLILTWRRYHLLGEQLKLVQNSNPSSIYIFSDGPSASEACKTDVALTREIIRRAQVNSGLIKSYFSRENLGLRSSVLTALGWIFTTEETAIILEDDVVASPEFFSYCNYYLSAYHQEPNVLTVSGSSFLPPSVKSTNKSYLSVYSQCWGWATWKRSWLDFYSFLTSSESTITLALKFFFSRCPSLRSLYWTIQFLKVRYSKVDSWSFELSFYSLLNYKYHVTPPISLTTNVGFDDKAVHTAIQPDFLQNNDGIDLSLHSLEQRDLIPSKKLDRITADTIYKYPRSIIGFFLRYLLSLMDISARYLKKSLLRSKHFLRRSLQPATLHLRDYDRRRHPLSSSMGFDRGHPIDRHYIHKFLASNLPTSPCRVLEFGDNMLSRSLMHKESIVDIAIYSDNATGYFQGNHLLLDLATAEPISSKNTYDVIICTQVLMCVPDPHQALANLHSLLKPNGLLIGSISSSCSPISYYDYSRWGYYWTGTDQYLHKLFQLTFFKAEIVQSFGSFYTARAFLDGLCSDDLDINLLSRHDPEYPIVTCFLARVP